LGVEFVAQEDNRWRDKYRQTLDQQEQLEKTLSAQQALLHRTVLALSNAAEGQDSELDKRLSAIRSSLKNNDVSSFDRMIKSIERVATEANQRREKQWSGVHKHFSAIVRQLPQLSPTADIKPATKNFIKAIPKGELLPATLNRLLEEFNKLQIQAADAIPKQGLMDRLFNKETPLATATINNTESPQAEWEAVEEDAPELEGELITPATEDDHTPQHRQRAIPEAVHERPTHEPAFSRISDRITIILTELLDYFPMVDCVEQKAIKARDRIKRGLNWYELVPTLQHIRDFVIPAHRGTDDNYRLYLKNVYAELSHITAALGLVIESEEQQRIANDTLHTGVSDGMNNIHQALNEHNNIDHLKTAVQAQVHSIQGALEENKQSQAVPEDSLSSQLSTLIERIQNMEQQDADIREELEQEKLRAITDSLTGLPNREAYSERVHSEMLRWQRYQHPLCLAVLDIDFFKKVNDGYGHSTGDKVLKAVSRSVAQRLREVDFIARFGGEEFIILLPETTAENALQMLNRTRERLAKTHMRSKKSTGEETKFTVTVSMGIAEFTEGDTAEIVFDRADKALYDAKENGRNQCIIG
jgi:diguanylate cyclase